MPFQFDPTKYHSVFPGEFGESPLQPSQVKPGEEVWNVKIYKLRANAAGVFEKYNQTASCQICGDIISHEHAWYYESEKPSSPAAQFVTSLRDKGGLVITDPRQIEGKQFQFEERLFKAGINPSTGQPGKDRRYFFVIGPVGYEPPEENPQETPEGSNPSTQPQTVATNTQAAPVANGVASSDDLLKRLAKISDGKSDLDAIRAEAKSDTAIFDNKTFFISVLNGLAFDEMVNKNLAVKGEGGVFHSVV